jgi:hypothetical protein
MLKQEVVIKITIEEGQDVRVSVTKNGKDIASDKVGNIIIDGVKTSGSLMHSDNKYYLIVNSLGISSGIAGYDYITYALQLIESRGYVGNICNELYPEIAKKFNKNTTKVERGIRHAIESTLVRSKKNSVLSKKWISIFPFCYDNKPTNKDFFSTLLDKMIRGEI